MEYRNTASGDVSAAFAARAFRGLAGCFLFLATAWLAILSSSGPSEAQSSGFDATGMWGTSIGSSGFPGATDSAAVHQQNGIVAGQVNAAELNLLQTTGVAGASITSIGSQSIVSNTIVGDGNSVDLRAQQTTKNTGRVSNKGIITGIASVD